MGRNPLWWIQKTLILCFNSFHSPEKTLHRISNPGWRDLFTFSHKRISVAQHWYGLIRPGSLSALQRWCMGLLPDKTVNTLHHVSIFSLLLPPLWRISVGEGHLIFAHMGNCTSSCRTNEHNHLFKLETSVSGQDARWIGCPGEQIQRLWTMQEKTFSARRWFLRKKTNAALNKEFDFVYLFNQVTDTIFICLYRISISATSI